MKVRERLARMLTAQLGFEVRLEDLYPARGWYRSSPRSDCLRWDGEHSIASWSTMTDCVRRGFTITEGAKTNSSGFRYEVTANQA